MVAPFFDSAGAVTRRSGDGPAGVGAGEAEVDEPVEVDGGGAVGEPDAVAFDAAVAELAVGSADEPRDAAFDHRAVLPVGVIEDVGARERAGRGEERVVGVQHDHAAVLGGRAFEAQRAVGAVATEAGVAARGEMHSDTGGAGDGAGGLVDVEVVEGEALVDRGTQRRRLDERWHLLVVEVVTELAGPVGGIAEDLGASRFVVDQVGGGFGVTDVAGTEIGVGDQAGVGLGCDMGLVAVAVGVLGLVHVPRLGIHRGDDPVRGGALGDAPPARPVTGFDVLACDQRQQGHRVELGLVQLEAAGLEVLGGPHQLVRVVDQLGDHPVDIGRVVPVTRGAAPFKVVLAHPHVAELGDELADPADLGDQHRDRVLTLHGVVEHGRVEHSAVLLGDHAGLVDHGAHRVEDPLRILALAQLVAPQRQHRRMERLIGQRQARRGLPRDVSLQGPARLTVGLAFQRLEHHHRGDHVRGHRRTAPTRAEQVGEHVIGEQAVPVLCEQRVHRTLPQQVTTQRSRVQQLTIRARRTLHPTILFDPRPDRESRRSPRIAQHSPRLLAR